MVSLLLLSMALSAPASAAQPAVVPGDTFGIVGLDVPSGVEEAQPQSFDGMAIHPETDVCYKIRAYIFSKGSNPRLIRETTCGPSRAATRKIEGSQPKLVPLDASGDKVRGRFRRAK